MYLHTRDKCDVARIHRLRFINANINVMQMSAVTLTSPNTDTRIALATDGGWRVVV